MLFGIGIGNGYDNGIGIGIGNGYDNGIGIGSVTLAAVC